MKRLFDCVGVHSNSKVSSVSVTSTPQTEGGILQSSNLKSFAFKQLKIATRNFRSDRILDDFCSVCKGWVDENSLTAAKPGTGMVIAVRRLNQEGLQGDKEWLTEINYLGQLHHENLVRLIGYCLEDDHRLLVYEFMPLGSLDNHLFRRASSFQPLSWNLRMKIAFGAAKGLAFLHSDEAKVIYRNLKSSNILLDSTYNAKLSDSGLATYGLDVDEGIDLDYDFDYIDERCPGSWFDVHDAPELWSTGHLTARSDVYSFGVVMLELLTGRRAVDKNRPSGEHNLVEWAKPYLASKRKVIQIFDSRIEGQYSLDEAHRAVDLAIRCLAAEPKSRPTMDDVVKALEQLQEPSDSEGSGREKKGKGGKRNRKKKVEGSGWYVLNIVSCNEYVTADS